MRGHYCQTDERKTKIDTLRKKEIFQLLRVMTISMKVVDLKKSFFKKRLVYQGNSVSNQKYSVAPNSISVFSADEYHQIRKQDAVTMIYHQRNVQYLLQNVGKKTFHT